MRALRQEGRVSPGVCLFVCLSVCLTVCRITTLQNVIKKMLTNFDEIFGGVRCETSSPTLERSDRNVCDRSNWNVLLLNTPPIGTILQHVIRSSVGQANGRLAVGAPRTQHRSCAALGRQFCILLFVC